MTQVFDWASAPNPVWRKLGPEIAEALREVATMPAAELRSLPEMRADVLPHRLSVADIQATVCAEFDIDRAALLGERRDRDLARPRHIAVYLAREITGKSFPQLGRAFNRDPGWMCHVYAIVRQTPELLQTALRIKALLNA